MHKNGTGPEIRYFHPIAVKLGPKYLNNLVDLVKIVDFSLIPHYLCQFHFLCIGLYSHFQICFEKALEFRIIRGQHYIQKIPSFL